MTVDDLRAFSPQVVVLPLGSIEPHGPHLPMGTDCFQVTQLARMAVEQANSDGARALLYPTIPITNNTNMTKLPFALGIQVRTLMSMIVDLVTQCKEQGVMKVVIINGHGGNPGALDAVCRELAQMDDMPFVCWTYGVSDDDFEDPIEHWSDHGGENETSRILWLRPDLIKQENFDDFPFGKLRIKELEKTNFVRKWHHYLPMTAGGETRTASAQKGKLIMEAKAAGTAKLLVALTHAQVDERFPYE